MKRLIVIVALLASCHREARPDSGGGAAAAGAAQGTGAQGTAAQGTAAQGAAAQGAAAQPPAAKPPPAKPPAAPSAAEQAALGQQPRIDALKPFEAPAPRIERLGNGLTVYLVERKGDGIESIRFVVRGGASADPASKPGLASLTAALLETGAGGRDQTALAAAADALGATLSVGATQDAVVASVSAMTTQLGPAVKLLADVALRPTLAEAEWKHVQEQREAALIDQRAEPGVAAVRAFRAAAYGDHALGRPVEGTIESVKATRLADVKAFYASFAPAGAALIAVGGAPADEVLRALRPAFEKWKPAHAARPPVKDGAVPTDRPRLVLVDFPGKPQSVVLVGQPAVPRSSPDFLALEAFNSVLGGSFTSRLNQNLRELHGYSYGAFSRFAFGRGPGAFAARSSVKTDVTGPSVGEILHELQLAVAEPVTAAELDKARALLAYQLVETLSHADALAAEVAGMFIDGLPPDELQTRVPRLQALTPQSVQAAAARALDPAHMTIGIAGDKAAVLPQLEKLGLPAPQLRDATGALLH